jgi:hypothetical protein
MKWWYFLVGGAVLIGIGLMIRKKQVDGAAHARAAKAEKAEMKVNETAAAV